MTSLPVVRRAAALGAAAVLTLAGLTACGDDDSPSSDEPKASESSSTATSPSAGATIDPSTFVDDVLAAMSEPTTAHLTMAMTGGSAEVSMEGDVDYTTKPAEMALTMSSSMMALGGDSDSASTIDVRVVDGVMYLKMPFGQSGKWVKLELGEKGGPLSEDMLDQLDPGAQLESLKDAITKVEDAGEDASGHHYVLTVRSDAFRELQDQLGGSGKADLPEVLTYDVWTDDEGRLAKSVVALGELGTVTMAFTDWGEDVDIEAPPESDVVEMPEGMLPGGTLGG